MSNGKTLEEVAEDAIEERDPELVLEFVAQKLEIAFFAAEKRDCEDLILDLVKSLGLAQDRNYKAEFEKEDDED